MVRENSGRQPRRKRVHHFAAPFARLGARVNLQKNKVTNPEFRLTSRANRCNFGNQPNVISSTNRQFLFNPCIAALSPPLVTSRMTNRPNFGVLVVWLVVTIAPAVWAAESNSTRSRLSLPEVIGKSVTGSPEKIEPEAGELVAHSIFLHAPLALFELERAPDQVPVWRFRGGSAQSLSALFDEAKLPEELKAALLTTAVTWQRHVGMTLLPTPEILLRLPLPSRQRIYEELAKSSFNPYHAAPLLIPRYLADEWLAHSPLSASHRESVRRLFWNQGGCFAFSDLSFLINTSQSTAEIRDCLRAWTLTRTVVVKVRIPTGTKLESFMRYWGAGEDNDAVLPFLQAMGASGSDATIELPQLLPPICRKLLYTYPSAASGVSGRFPDCNWTALNFFASDPDPYYLDSKQSYLELAQDYEQIPAATQLGDLICFTDKAGQIVHSCVHVAGNIVFTKNGAGLASPWLLMPYSDVEAIYRSSDAIDVHCLRKKSFTRPKT